MTTRLPIGDFSRMTYLSVKALRRYHDMGLLEPADVDPSTGYRYYDASQVPIGQVIRRFRDLGMPLDQLKDVLHAPDAASRNELIVAHLRQMEEELDHTQQTVASLRAILERPVAPITVEYRKVVATSALAISEPVAMVDIDTWWGEAFNELHRALVSMHGTRCGPDGALYPSEFFEDELGVVVVYIPVAGRPELAGPDPAGRVQLVDIPDAELAVTVHHGAFAELDQTYGSLGTFVAEREIGVAGPIREHYVVSNEHTDDESRHRTEVCWPVFHTKGGAT
ncbi:MAG: MerR family transcriptional regulator [Actinomycetota bacterium]|nr:MerR family transcriptional regulator [Actinomycetota bacterium]